MADKITVEAVDAALAGWQQGAGSDWQDVLRKRRELCRTEYEGAGRIDAAWEAVLLSRVLGEPVPAWLGDYLAVVAMGIHNLSVRSTQGQPVKPVDLGRALGSVQKGAGTGFPSDKDWKWAVYAVQARDEIRAGSDERYAFDHVADREGISWQTVRTAWKRLQAEHPEMI
jgi:hypothetical protein